MCTRCDHTHVTREAAPHTPFHPCPGVGGLTSPMTADGEKVNVTVKLREDYEAGERVTRDDAGRPVMAIEVERADGNDVAVFAPAARMDAAA